MVEFLKDVPQNSGEFTFKAGERYPSMDSPEGPDKILIRQPNSPKHKNWWSTFPKSVSGDVFRMVERHEMTVEEIKEENKCLQY